MNISCALCKGKMQPGTTELVLRRDRSVVVLEDVPALICQQCGEASVDAETSKKAYQIAESEINKGVALEFCKYKKAA